MTNACRALLITQLLAGCVTVPTTDGSTDTSVEAATGDASDTGDVTPSVDVPVGDASDTLPAVDAQDAVTPADTGYRVLGGTFATTGATPLPTGGAYTLQSAGFVTGNAMCSGSGMCVIGGIVP